jgi:glucan phosphoethanolaminetransferase (alkaline phosphatase superfamily)
VHLCFWGYFLLLEFNLFGGKNCMQPIPLLDSSLFVGLVVALVVFVAVIAARSSSALRLRVLLAIAAWLGLTALLSMESFYHDFSTMPPRPIIPALVSILSGILFLRSASGKSLLGSTPASWLIGFQVFRVLMEIILWLVYEHGIIPVQMTFEGRNFDILVGLTAPFVAYLLHLGRIKPMVAVVWNIAGLGLLMNIVIVAALSTPSPLRVFMNEPANTFIAYFPFVWLVAFVVPMAFCGHIASLMQLWKKGS